jgi:hypothetical protein
MRPDLKMVLAEVEGVRKYRRDGFTASETMLSTEMLEKAALKGAGGMARLRCPARPPARQDRAPGAPYTARPNLEEVP